MFLIKIKVNELISSSDLWLTSSVPRRDCDPDLQHFLMEYEKRDKIENRKVNKQEQKK